MATHTDTLSKIYAKSLFEMAQAAGDVQAIEETLDELEQLVAAQGDRAVAKFFSSALITKSRRHDLLKKGFGGKVSDLTLRFLLLLNDNDRMGHLLKITAAFRQLLEQMRGKMEVEVTTAGPMGEEQFAALKHTIQTALGREPMLVQSVDPSMIGGLKIKIGDRLIDGSVAGRLRRMRHGLLTTGDAAIRLKASSIAG